MASIDPRRHVKLHLSAQLIARLLETPDDVSVVRILPTLDPDGIDVLLASERFDEVPFEAEAPYFHGATMSRVGVADDPVLPDGDYFRIEANV